MKFLRQLSFGLNGGVAIVVAASLFLVAISYALYATNQYYKYDLARPDVKSKVTVSASGLDDTTSVVDAEAVQQSLDFMNQEVKLLDDVSEFESRALSNTTLNLNYDD